MNNSNFGYDCCNNFENCYFTPVVGEIEEMAYIRKHQSIHDPSNANFFSTDHLQIQFNKDFDNKIAKLNVNDNFYEAKNNNLGIQRKKELDACKSIKESKRRNHLRDVVKEVDQLVEDLEHSPKAKTIHEFHSCHAASIKAIGVKNSDIVGPSTRSSTEKMLMFAKLSLMSFIYELTEIFMFLSEKTRAIYSIYCIDFVYVYQILTDMDNTALQFVIFSKEKSKVPEKMFRDILFLVIINSKVLDRFDVSHEFWQQFNVRDEKTHKPLGLYEIEHIDDPCLVTIATNPKEYIEYFQSEYINKEHKGIKKSENSMNLKSFAERINSLSEIENYEKKDNVSLEQARFTVKKMT